MELYILYGKCTIALLIGFLYHFNSKYNEAFELYTKGNVGDNKFSFLYFFKFRPASHIINFIVCLFWMLVLPDFVKQHPTVGGSVYYANIVHIVACAVWGWGNSSLFLKLMGTGTKKFMDVIDSKTNIADGK